MKNTKMILKSELVKLKICEEKDPLPLDNITVDLLCGLGDNGLKIVIVMVNMICMSND